MTALYKNKINIRLSTSRLSLLSIFSVIVFAQAAFACVLGPMSDDKQLKIHDVVFSGTLEECVTEENVSFLKYSIKRIWKGDIQKEYTKIVPECRYDFLPASIGKEALIFANKVNGSPHLKADNSLCAPSRSLLIRQTTYLFGLPLPSFFDKIEIDDLADLGPPIHEFN